MYLKQKLTQAQVLLIDFVCVFFMVVLWNLNHGHVWPPLLLLLFPIYLHWIYRYSVPYPGIRSILPVFIVLLAVGISIAVAYDTQNALEKGLVILGACFLFGVITIQPPENIHKMIVVTGILGGTWAILFLLTQRWDLRVVDVGFVNKVIAKWDSIRPKGYKTFIQNEDILGGVLAIFTPLLISVWILRRKYKGSYRILITPIILALVLLGVFISGSRPAWAGLIISIMFYALLFFAFFAKRGTRRLAAIVAGLFIVFLLVVGGLSDFQNSSAFLGNRISNIASLKERQILYQQTYYLMQDFPFTGGGLASFPGLYSRYILKIPNLYLSYGHHLYLDLWLELGLLGLMGFVLITIQSLIVGFKGYQEEENTELGIFHIAVLSSMVGLLFSGFYEDPVFGLKGTVFLLFLPGLTVAINRGSQKADQNLKPKKMRMKCRQRYMFIGVCLVMAVGISFVITGNALLSKWYSNMGSVSLAKVSLAGWPEESPGEFDAIDTQSAENYFEKALQYNSENFTANFQQGIIAFWKQDFVVAQNYLEKALKEAPDHSGVVKYLAYSYAWAGDEPKAFRLFVEIPGAKQELKIYGGWLESINRTDLSKTAFSLANKLQ